MALQPLPPPLRLVRPAPDRELPPERAAEVSVLAQLAGRDAANVRARRRKPDGWVPVHLGISARTQSDGHTRGLEGEHASHWAWVDLVVGLEAMAALKQRGATTSVLRVWCGVWSPSADGVVTVGPPKHYDLFVHSLCWKLSAEDVPDAWARRAPGTEKLEWRALERGETEYHVLR